MNPFMHVRPAFGGFRRCTAALLLLSALVPAAGRAQPVEAGAPATVRVVSEASGQRLQVDGRDFMVLGMNWDYTPIGQNYMFDLWNQPEAVIMTALDREMPLLRSMGVNAIRLYPGIPARWVRTIYERYGIWTVINHPMGRYGFTIDGAWIPSVDYADPKFRAAVTAEIVGLVDQYRDVPGFLMWILGNENNYGLAWTSFEAEALPEGEQDAARARHLYSLFNEITRAVKAKDPRHPVAIANGDVQYIDIIAAECKDIDILGTNCYRGISARDLFQVVQQKLGKPVMFTEFGADAFNAKELREDQPTQARYLIGQWEEIYEQSGGKGRVGNAIGGFIFQWSDGWWKFGQESRLDVHDTNASWPNGGYAEDFEPGQNNMNEEWWGICARGPADDRGLYDLYPRAAFYALRDAFRLDPYAPTTTLETIRAHFNAVTPAAAALQARGDRAALVASDIERIRLTGVQLRFETYSTGGDKISTPPSTAPSSSYPAYKGFDHMESFYTDFEARPAENVRGTLSLNILGNVARNPIDEIFYENRGRAKPVLGADGGTVTLNDMERVKVYRAGLSWEDRHFMLNGFYRTGHYHWGYEGDFFGLYREANYGGNIDTYNGEAPLGFEMEGRQALHGLKLAFGPQLWWGANPSAMLKYQRTVGRYTATAVWQEDLTSQKTGATSSTAVPIPPTRKGTLHLTTRRGPWNIEAGWIWAGATKIGDEFQVAEKSGDSYHVLLDHVRKNDVFGGKAKIAYQKGRWNWYGQAARMGLVADGGPTGVTTYTGWGLKDTGSGNQNNVLTGLLVNMGNFQFGPNVLWQKPIVGPVPAGVPQPGRPRNVLDDPFAVRANRETFGAELMLGWDPTPATWMWAWDNDVREDARLAASLDVIFRHLPTTQDASIGILGDGVTTFAFPGAPPPRDLWEARLRTVSRLSADTRVAGTLYVGTGEPNGNDTRKVTRAGADLRVTRGPLFFTGYAKLDDWGPYDYHRDFNLTYPMQLMGDLAYTLGTSRWFADRPQTKIGVRTTWRSLDQYSARFCPIEIPNAAGTPECVPTVGETGHEWEIRTYLTVAM